MEQSLPGIHACARTLYIQGQVYAPAAMFKAHRVVTDALPTFLSSTWQLGALAEFRADWPSALRMYGEAYGYLPQVRQAFVVYCSKATV